MFSVFLKNDRISLDWESKCDIISVRQTKAAIRGVSTRECMRVTTWTAGDLALRTCRRCDLRTLVRQRNTLLARRALAVVLAVHFLHASARRGLESNAEDVAAYWGAFEDRVGCVPCSAAALAVPFVPLTASSPKQYCMTRRLSSGVHRLILEFRASVSARVL